MPRRLDGGEVFLAARGGELGFVLRVNHGSLAVDHFDGFRRELLVVGAEAFDVELFEDFRAVAIVGHGDQSVANRGDLIVGHSAGVRVGQDGPGSEGFAFGENPQFGIGIAFLKFLESGGGDAADDVALDRFEDGVLGGLEHEFSLASADVVDEVVPDHVPSQSPRSSGDKGLRAGKREAVGAVGEGFSGFGLADQNDALLVVGLGDRAPAHGDQGDGEVARLDQNHVVAEGGAKRLRAAADHGRGRLEKGRGVRGKRAEARPEIAEGRKRCRVGFAGDGARGRGAREAGEGRGGIFWNGPEGDVRFAPGVESGKPGSRRARGCAGWDFRKPGAGSSAQKHLMEIR